MDIAAPSGGARRTFLLGDARPASLCLAKAAVIALLLALPTGQAVAQNESARGIPLAYSVDVVVVGGSTHAVAAAVEAARGGAEVFLAAPRPYLGEDLCATLRLHLPPGQEPSTELGRQIFDCPEPTLLPSGVPLQYRADVASARRHRDTRPPSRLTDGRAASASADSVQYDSDVTITATLGGEKDVKRIRLFAFEKAGDYGVGEVIVRADGKRIDKAEGLQRRVAEDTGHPWSRLELSLPVQGTAEQLEIHIKRPEGCRRLLLGELVVQIERQPAEGNDRTDDKTPPVTATTTPQRVKTVLDRALVDAGVRFLLGCYPTDVLVDRHGRPAGIVMANRAGRQAVVANVIVDATPQATVARLAGAQRRPWSGDTLQFKRVVLSRNAAGQIVGQQHRLALPMPDLRFQSFMEAEHTARDRTYRKDQLRASAFLFQIPPVAIVGRKEASAYEQGGPAELGHFRPKSVDRLYVLSGSADLPREEMTALLEPLGLVPAAQRVGTAAAREAAELPIPASPRVLVPSEASEEEQAQRDERRTGPSGDVREVLRGIRPVDRDRPTVPSPQRDLPLLGRYDVVVIGGGTAGAAAGIGAARQGASTLVVEYLEGLGGVGTLGLIGKPYHGRDVGFAAEVPFPGKNVSIENKMEWYRRELREAGADVWFGVLGCGVWSDGDRVKGAVVVTPQGRGIVLANTTIDATGNADLAVAAGADYLFGANAQHIALQGTGFPVRPLGRHYVNSDYLLVDESDMVDVWRTLVGARAAMSEGVFDSGTLIQTRERRRVVGEHVLRYLDQVAGRTYPDSVVLSASDYDSHGYPSQAYFALLPHDDRSRKKNHPAPGGECYTPYRCLLPKGLDGMLVAGVGISMERDATAMVRMQLDISNQGYAAGVAAAMAAAGEKTARQIDIRRLQKHLVDTGALPAEVLTHDDSFPLPAEVVNRAVADLADASNPTEAARPLAIVLSHRRAALPMLRAAFASAEGEAKLVYARILGMLGDDCGLEVLVAALDEAQWDDKILQGVAAEYAHLPTPVDALVLALGNTRSADALPPILRKLETLDADTTLSHHRAVALALEEIGSRSAAEPLARLLEKPGMRGHVMTALEPQHNAAREKRRRTGPLREIVLARALYRCGDHQGLGEEILREYLRDIRGLFARHAQAVLESPRSARSNRRR